MRFLKLLYVQVLIAIVIGVLIGHYAPQLGVDLKPLGDGFIRLIKMLIAPIIFCTVVLGIAGMDNLRHVGRVGLFALGYFEIVTTLALLLGLAVVNIVEPGSGMHVNPAALDPERISSYVSQAEKQSLVDFVLNIVPTTFFDAFARGEILQVLLIAVLCGFALQACGARVATLRSGIEGFSAVLFKVVGLVVPSGYSFNLDGTCIYLTMAAVFLAQATDTPMTMSQQLVMLAVLLLTSKGAAGVTGSGFIVLAGTLAAVDGPPLAALALILGIDRFMSEARALTNLVGNALATLVVSRWTGAWQPPAQMPR